MNSDIRRFLFRLIALTCLLFLTSMIIFRFILKDYYLPVFPYMMLLFFIVTAITHIYQIVLIKKNIAKFARSNMLSTTFKLLIYSGFSIIYLAINSEKAIPFIIFLFLLYLIYTIFEVIELTTLNRQINKKNQL